jgi:hypothetical protein
LIAFQLKKISGQIQQSELWLKMHKRSKRTLNNRHSIITKTIFFRKTCLIFCSINELDHTSSGRYEEKQVLFQSLKFRDNSYINKTNQNDFDAILLNPDCQECLQNKSCCQSKTCLLFWHFIVIVTVRTDDTMQSFFYSLFHANISKLSKWQSCFN